MTSDLDDLSDLSDLPYPLKEELNMTALLGMLIFWKPTDFPQFSILMLSQYANTEEYMLTLARLDPVSAQAFYIISNGLYYSHLTWANWF